MIIVGVSLFVFTVAKNVYPDMLFLRLFFAVGASASGSMITAILSEISTFRVSPTKLVRKFWLNTKANTLKQIDRLRGRSTKPELSISADGHNDPYHNSNSPLISQYTDGESHDETEAATSSAAAAAPLPQEPSPWAGTDPESDDEFQNGIKSNNNGSGFYGRGDVETEGHDDDEFFEVVQPGTRNGKGTAMVGVMTGLGACFGAFVLVALPMRLRLNNGLSPTAAVKVAYYIVGSIALFIGSLLLLGLHNDRTKKIMYWLTGRIPEADRVALGVETSAEQSTVTPDGQVIEQVTPSYFELLKQGFSIALEDKQIALAYCGAFIARSTTVATVMFIPLLIAANMHDASPRCASSSVPASELYGTCKRGYVLSFSVMGMTQTCTLLFAPLWGYTTDRFGRKVTMLVSSVIGVIAFLGFGISASTSAELILYTGGNDDADKSSSALAGAPGGAMLAIYSLGSLMGVAQIGSIISSMSMCTDTKRVSSGSIAGVYSFCGGLGILVLSFVGGRLADFFPGAPFIIIAMFYLVLIGLTVAQMPVLKDRLERMIPENRQISLEDDDNDNHGDSPSETPRQTVFQSAKSRFDSWSPLLKHPSTWIPGINSHGQIRLGNDESVIHYDD